MKINIKYNYNGEYYFITSDSMNSLINKIDLTDETLLNCLSLGKVIDVHIKDETYYDFIIYNSKKEERAKYFDIKESMIFNSPEEFKKCFYSLRKKRLKVLISQLRKELKNYKNG